MPCFDTYLGETTIKKKKSQNMMSTDMREDSGPPISDPSREGDMSQGEHRRKGVLQSTA